MISCQFFLEKLSFKKRWELSAVMSYACTLFIPTNIDCVHVCWVSLSDMAAKKVGFAIFGLGNMGMYWKHGHLEFDYYDIFGYIN